IPDPFTTDPGSRLYRTGDLGRYLSDGRIHFEGRADDQVKIRGFRIEPGEIQAVITSHPQVRQAYVIAVTRPSQGLQLVAWYAVEPTAELSLKELRAWVEQRLPNYMRPAAYVSVEQLPLTSHGKVDRLRLPTPEEGSADHRPTLSSAPHGAVERTLARI